MAIISVRIFIRSIVLRKKNKKIYVTIPPEERFTFTPKGQVILRGKPNKAVQVNCLFPRLSIPPLFFFFPCRWSILNRYEHSRNWNLTCTVRGNFLPWTQDPGKPAFLTNDRLLSNIEARETKTSVFFQTYVLVYVWNIYHWPRETQHKTCL